MPITHGAKATRCHPLVGLFKAEVLRRPHLVLAYFGGDVAIFAVLGQLFEALQGVLWFDDLFALGECQAVDLAPLLELVPPLGDTVSLGFTAAGFPDLQHILKNKANVANDWNIRLDDLVDRGGVDIDVRLFGVWREFIENTRDPVIKARADVDHQIAVMHGHVGLIQTVHSQHAQPFIAGGGVGTKAHQRGCDRETRRFNQFTQQLAGCGARIDDAAACVEQRLFGFLHCGD